MSPTTFPIFLGDSKTMSLRVDEDDCCGGGPIDLTNCTEIDVQLPYADGTIKHLLLSLSQVAILVPANLGKFSVPILSVVSSLLNVGEFQDFQVTFTIAGVISTVRFTGALSVFQ